MKQSTRQAMLEAYNSMQPIIARLYAEYEQAFENEDFADASLLEARANKLFQEADSILQVISEHEND